MASWPMRALLRNPNIVAGLLLSALTFLCLLLLRIPSVRNIAESHPGLLSLLIPMAALLLVAAMRTSNSGARLRAIVMLAMVAIATLLFVAGPPSLKHLFPLVQKGGHGFLPVFVATLICASILNAWEGWWRNKALWLGRVILFILWWSACTIPLMLIVTPSNESLKRVIIGVVFALSPPLFFLMNRMDRRGKRRAAIPTERADKPYDVKGSPIVEERLSRLNR